jgi:hypothetical protein
MAVLAKKLYTERRFGIVVEYYELTRETEKHRFKELEAAVKLQAYYRMHMCLVYYKEMQLSVLKLQRAWRCHLIRKRFWKRIEEELTFQRQEMYAAAVLTIQRVFRGFYFRKYHHDFYARKQYIEHLKSKNTEMRASMQTYYEGLLGDQARQQEQYARLEFHRLASSLHHLASTKAIPGVYRHLEQVSDFGKTAINL